MKKTVKDDTVKNHLCIGCGICKAVCPCGAIKMVFTKEKEYQPDIEIKSCSGCEKCLQFCPQTRQKVISEAKKICLSDENINYGLGNAEYFVAYERDDTKRIRSASGGFTTALASYLLETKIIDCIIHAGLEEAPIGGIHYRVASSTTLAEIEDRRSSFYFPIEYSETLLEFRNVSKKLLIIGVPCVIRGINELFRNHSEYCNNQIYTLALACGHNVTGHYIDFLAESLGINEGHSFKVNLRNKDNIQDANNFNNHFYTDTEDLIKKNRFESVFTKTWRNYYFSLNACHFCSDFWGYTADITVKDAWGKWAVDPLGKNIVVIRHPLFSELITKIKNINYEYLDFDAVSNCQYPTTEYKQLMAIDRLNKFNLSKRKIKSGYFKYRFFTFASKKLYHTFGYHLTQKILFSILAALEKTKKIIEQLTYRYQVTRSQQGRFQKALRLFRKNRFKSCIRILGNACYFNDNSQENYYSRFFYIGSAYEKLSAYHTALEYFELAEKHLEVFNNNLRGSLFFHMAYCMENVDELGTMPIINYYQRCLEHIPDHAQAKFGLNKTAGSQGQVSKDNICEFCGGKASFIYHMSAYEIYQCSKCSSAYVANMPTDQELQTYYSGFKFNATRENITIFEHDIFEKWVSSLGLPKGAKTLDIGGGGGFFSYIFQKTGLYDSYYIDLDDEACRFASEELNIKYVVNGDALHLDRYFDQKFDFIYSRHLIEHLKNPTQFIDSVLDKLAPNGVFMLQFPNGRSLEYFGYPNLIQPRIEKVCQSNKGFTKNKTIKMLFGKRVAHGIDPIRHLWAISPKGICKYLDQKGVKYQIKTAPLSDLVYSPYNKVNNRLMTNLINNTLVKIHGGTHLIVLISK